MRVSGPTSSDIAARPDIQPSGEDDIFDAADAMVTGEGVDSSGSSYTVVPKRDASVAGSRHGSQTFFAPLAQPPGSWRRRFGGRRPAKTLPCQEEVSRLIEAVKKDPHCAWELYKFVNDHESAAVILPIMIDAAWADRKSGSIPWRLSSIAQIRPDLYSRAHVRRIFEVIADIASRPEDEAEGLRSLVSIPMRVNFNGVGREHILLLAKADMTASAKAEIFYKVLEPLSLRMPEKFTPDVVNVLAKSYGDLAGFIYLRHNVNPAGARKYFPLQAAFMERMRSGKRRVLLWFNVADGMGDTIIRSVRLVRALLALNPDLEVTIYTGRRFLYSTVDPELGIISSHPRVNVRSFEEMAQLPDEGPFDMVVRHYYTRNRYTGSYLGESYRDTFDIGALEEPALKKTIEDHPPFVRVDVWHDSSLYTRSRIIVGDRVCRHKSRGDDDNIYIAWERLAAEIGLSSLYGRTDRPFMLNRPNPIAERWWKENVVVRAGSRRVIMLCPFGGLQEKGFNYANEADRLSFVRAVGRLVSRECGCFVVVLPNGWAWGSYELAQKFVALLKPSERKYVAIAPSPVKDETDRSGIGDVSEPARATLFKYFLDYARANTRRRRGGLLTVEGGLLHLAKALELPFGMWSTYSSGAADTWFPPDASEEQLAGSLEGFVERLRRPHSWLPIGL